MTLIIIPIFYKYYFIYFYNKFFGLKFSEWLALSSDISCKLTIKAVKETTDKIKIINILSVTDITVLTLLNHC